MKRTALATILLASLGMVVPASQAWAQVSVNVSIGGFYDELSPYGEWVDCTYGECWVPRGVGAGWQPYTNGQWIYTRYGWTWVSSDPWGGSPYHYGTWALFGRYGWVWVPGTVWAPAWVTWSYSDRYVGWAPIPPTWAFGRGGYSGRAVVVNQAQYVFVPTNRFVGTNVASVRLEPRRNAEFFRQAKPVTRFEVSGGIVRNAAVPFATVQRAMGGRIETREVGTANTTARPFSPGGVARSGNVAVVAPARDVKAARASWQASGRQRRNNSSGRNRRNSTYKRRRKRNPSASRRSHNSRKFSSSSNGGNSRCRRNRRSSSRCSHRAGRHRFSSGRESSRRSRSKTGNSRRISNRAARSRSRKSRRRARTKARKTSRASRKYLPRPRRAAASASVARRPFQPLRSVPSIGTTHALHSGEEGKNDGNGPRC